MRNILLGISMILPAMFLSACGVFRSEPLTNTQARVEADKFVEEAETAYKSASSQMDAIFAEPVGKDKLASIKEKKPKFEQAAADFKIAKDKFSLASAKFNEAMNGGSAYQSKLHLKFYYLSQAYKKWSELADVEMQLAQEAINIKDIKSFLSKTGELEEKAKKLNEEVNQKIENSRNVRAKT